MITRYVSFRIFVNVTVNIAGFWGGGGELVILEVFFSYFSLSVDYPD